MKARVFLLCFLLLSSNFRFLQSEETIKNKFREREATDDSLAYPNLDEDELLNTQCPQHLELRWQTEVSSSVYASPLIADINRSALGWDLVLEDDLEGKVPVKIACLGWIAAREACQTQNNLQENYVLVV